MDTQQVLETVKKNVVAVTATVVALTLTVGMSGIAKYRTGSFNPMKAFSTVAKQEEPGFWNKHGKKVALGVAGTVVGGTMVMSGIAKYRTGSFNPLHAFSAGTTGTTDTTGK